MKYLLYPLISLLLQASPSLAEEMPLVIREAWVREGPPTAEVLAAYMTLVNNGSGDITVVGIDSPQFGSVEIHRTVLEDGIARMVPQAGLIVPAGGELVLEPGGRHLMLMNPGNPLKEGDTVDFLFHLSDDTRFQFDATVRKGGDQQPQHHHHHHHSIQKYPMDMQQQSSASLTDYIRSLPLYPLPHHLLSRAMYSAARWQWEPWKNAMIGWFIDHYRIDLADARITDPHGFPSFNSFFTRALRQGARPLHGTDDSIISPVDGRISQIGRIADGRIFQAKGRSFSLVELLGGDAERAAPFQDGIFATLYLSPRDYHRVHMPTGGRLQETVYIPGRLFSVAPHTTRSIPDLFARNERMAAVFDTTSGPMAMVLIGAVFVGCIETVWSGVVTPPHRDHIEVTSYRAEQPGIQLDRGEEMGRFNMGSTVIVLYGPGQAEWEPDIQADNPVRMGEAIGLIHS